MIRFILCFAALLFCLEANAGECHNGRCNLRPAAKVVQSTRQVTGEVVQATKSAVRVVTPPYGRRYCRNGRCYVR